MYWLERRSSRSTGPNVFPVICSELMCGSPGHEEREQSKWTMALGMCRRLRFYSDRAVLISSLLRATVSFSSFCDIGNKMFNPSPILIVLCPDCQLNFPFPMAWTFLWDIEFTSIRWDPQRLLLGKGNHTSACLSLEGRVLASQCLNVR